MKVNSSFAFFFWFAFGALRVASQTFATGGGMDYGTLSLSRACYEALNTTVTCSSMIDTQSFSQVLPLQSSGLQISNQVFSDASGELLNIDQLDDLCVGRCRSDLVSVRNGILEACDASRDTLEVNNIAYPATYIVDSYLFTYDTSCYKDQQTGQYCDVVIADARNASIDIDCTDCMLGTYSLQLGSPIGYEEDFASDFSSLTESCNAFSYQYTTPGAYGSTIRPTASSSGAPPTPTCSRTYATSAGDTCQSISQARDVSTYGLITLNNLDFYCSALPRSLCLPGSCETHIWTTTDTCNSVASQYNVSMVNFLSWNPIFDECTPGGSVPAPSKPSAVPVPDNAREDSETNCGRWYTVQEGDNCFSILGTPDSPINFAQFQVLNPSVDDDCTNLWLGSAYCMVPIDPVVVTASTTFTRTTTTTVTPTVPPTTATLFPHAPGSVSTCTAWVNYETNDVGEDADVSLNDSWSLGLIASLLLAGVIVSAHPEMDPRPIVKPAPGNPVRRTDRQLPDPDNPALGRTDRQLPAPLAALLLQRKLSRVQSRLARHGT
ncbi:hypothetical protein B0I35DRAFT_485026 [Stachybotrys elegans]|uniref:LysM domain-containing protein n=1 Tax=Stachybotrys elegans TaxID=80388 RepID=A0A8K0SE50_9HYPO|nr:hypothetical protein B0I35DRAFT_485026 [Stachybotrys elegans]